ncbi:hypothetical protein COY07_04510 [Candidatus Peregrinibacteria bacterium CG_4_10_14_0_2_um_filter_43_11]|nr:MAG: hypothetical protein COY07_04510 [Candidatus Peregrinibacteria bacterium CG_4_10_14_0_2_um_filter_43_11]
MSVHEGFIGDELTKKYPTQPEFVPANGDVGDFRDRIGDIPTAQPNTQIIEPPKDVPPIPPSAPEDTPRPDRGVPPKIRKDFPSIMPPGGWRCPGMDDGWEIPRA